MNPISQMGQNLWNTRFNPFNLRNWKENTSSALAGSVVFVAAAALLLCRRRIMSPGREAFFRPSPPPPPPAVPASRIVPLEVKWPCQDTELLKLGAREADIGRLAGGSRPGNILLVRGPQQEGKSTLEAGIITLVAEREGIGAAQIFMWRMVKEPEHWVAELLRKLEMPIPPDMTERLKGMHPVAYLDDYLSQRGRRAAIAFDEALAVRGKDDNQLIALGRTLRDARNIYPVVDMRYAHSLEALIAESFPDATTYWVRPLSQNDMRAYVDRILALNTQIFPKIHADVTEALYVGTGGRIKALNMLLRNLLRGQASEGRSEALTRDMVERTYAELSGTGNYFLGDYKAFIRANLSTSQQGLLKQLLDGGLVKNRCVAEDVEALGKLGFVVEEAGQLQLRGRVIRDAVARLGVD